jgi:hypothetical protein
LTSSEYKIYLKRNDKKILGKLKSNFTGSIYNLYMEDNKTIKCSIIFGQY